ncbi:hypothetical protein [Methylobacterium planeticum]|uniref:Uncharacterized protein n=1 Tax=Methylobacterium planeticum TaxID=2615211 RepID=A0A6N6MP62_9HYPH|nr:hypothetical protein [Methylobacterium planeticum]KAB1072737.1 hypothetical protein F6X51_14090 [Methylobacterium planeticum]
MLQFAALWLLLSGIYLLFAGTLSLTETAAAVLCGLLAAIWTRCAGDPGEIRFRLRPDLFRPVLRAASELPGQTFSVGLRLAKAAVRGGSGGSALTAASSTLSRFSLADSNPEARADRAVGILAASLAPRSYVVRLDPERGIVVMHDLSVRSESGTAA